MAHRVTLLKHRLLGFLSNALIVGEEHRPLRLTGFIIPVWTSAAGARLPGGVLLPRQHLCLAPHGITDPLALILRSFGLPGHLEGRVQVPSPLLFRQFRRASTVSLWDPNSYHQHRNKQFTFHADSRVLRKPYMGILVERNETNPQLPAAPVR